jgi:helix-turn-helix protein
MESYEISQEKPDHHYRTEIPNIIFEIIQGNDLLVYCFLKRIAGDFGKCFMSVPSLAKKIGISENTLRDSKKNLCAANEFLGYALIRCTERTKPDGSRDTDLLEIRDIWRHNGDHFREKSQKRGGSNSEGGVVQILRGGGSKTTEEEDLSKEDLSKEQQRAVVVVPAAREEFCKSDVHRIGLPRGWTSDEIDKAWEVYDRNRQIVSSPMDYIQGIIEKTRVITQSKKNKKEVPCHTTPATPQETLQERRARVKQKFLENATETNILETYMQQEREKFKTRLCPS